MSTYISSLAAENGMCGIITRRAGYAAARMRARAAQIKRINWRFVLRPLGQRTHKKHLLKRNVTVEDIAFRNAKGLFQVRWREHTPRNNRAGNIWRELAD